MLGSGSSFCGRPVSWWCSEAWRCAPKIAPDLPSTSTDSSQMADCDQCNVRFSILRRRRECDTCGLMYCGSCIKRTANGNRSCRKCLVLSKWPLESSEVAALRVKDLRHFLHSQHINTVACTEKKDLIELVTRHVSSQHRSTASSMRFDRRHEDRNTNIHNSTNNKSPPPPSSSVTRDDGIRVRASSATNNESNLGSIRVRPMDSIRVRPVPSSPDSDDYDPETDLGIRVFATERVRQCEQRTNSVSPVSVEGYSESAEEECSRCPSADCTASSCSLDSCHGGASSHHASCSLHANNSCHCSVEDISASSEGRPVPDIGSTEASTERLNINSQGHSENSTVEVEFSQGENGTLEAASNGRETATDTQTNPKPSTPALDDDLPDHNTSSSSSSNLPSAASSPEPIKPFGPGSVTLEDLKSQDDIRRLSVRQCKELLALHRVNYSGVREKSELLNKIDMLWKDHQISQQDIEEVPEEMVCKICMDSMIDCVFLECGHMVACTPCGKQMAECPVCRQYVVRVVRTFRA